jgi:FkbM family methyltransferase
VIVEVELDGDHYGKAFWQRVSDRHYEPDTIGFIENNCNSDTDFMDIGAANGAMTLIAATQGSRVSSYEPDPKMHRVLCRNVELNESINKLITIHNRAISSEPGELNFSKGEDSSILSSIVFTGHDEFSSTKVLVQALRHEIDAFHIDKSRNLVIKMDIEGAEWKVLKSEETLKSLQRNKATLLLATHPGFYRPFVPKIRGLDYFRFSIWKFQNHIESVEVFSMLRRYGSISRTNLDPVHTQNQFAKLISAGYLEFVIEFS